MAPTSTENRITGQRPKAASGNFFLQLGVLLVPSRNGRFQTSMPREIRLPLEDRCGTSGSRISDASIARAAAVRTAQARARWRTTILKPNLRTSTILGHLLQHYPTRMSHLVFLQARAVTLPLQMGGFRQVAIHNGIWGASPTVVVPGITRDRTVHSWHQGGGEVRATAR